MIKDPIFILLADDDKDDRLLFKEALSELPIPTELLTVQDGEELMDYLFDNSKELPDVLFLDLNMPRKNGFECLSEIKHHKKLKQLPVIMLSTSYPRDVYYEEDIISLLYKIGALYYIRKPNDFMEFKQLVYHALNIAIEKIPFIRQNKNR